MMMRRPIRFTEILAKSCQVETMRSPAVARIASIVSPSFDISKGFGSRWPPTKCFWSAPWSIAADKDKRQARLSMISATGGDDVTGNVYVENGKVKIAVSANACPATMSPASATTRWPSSSSISGEHHADQGFIFNQEYARFGHFSPPAAPHRELYARAGNLVLKKCRR